MKQQSVFIVALLGLFLAGTTFPTTANAQTGFSAAGAFSWLPLNNGSNPFDAQVSNSPNQFNDGNFNPYGVYGIPANGVYHFDANVLIKVASGGPPNQNADLRLLTCGWAGCSNAAGQCASPVNNYPWQGTNSTLAQGGSVWMGSAPDGYWYPNYTVSVSYTGYLFAGDNVGVCVDNWAASGGSIQMVCGSPGACNFSGFKVQ